MCLKLLNLSQKIDKEDDSSVFTCENPTGSIAPGNSKQVFWLFMPLELKKYQYQTICVSDCGDVLPILISGEGCEQSMINQIHPQYPLSKILIADNSVIKVSSLVIKSLQSKLLTLSNVCDKEVYFRWRSTYPQSQVRIIPCSGKVSAHSKELLRVYVLGDEKVGINAHAMICDFTAGKFIDPSVRFNSEIIFNCSKCVAKL